ncbi:MAG: glucuronyl esterase domain-containing protein [Acidobacteriaceae bacterium]
MVARPPALVAMAYDPRFAIGYISSPGEAGAKLYRRNFGEQVGNIAGTEEYHWMAGNFLRYDGPLTTNDLPVDANELIALCAPRPVFISGGATHGDSWVDAKGMFLAAVGADPVYRLLGKKGAWDDAVSPHRNSSHRNSSHRRRPGIPAASPRTHAGAELALVSEVRGPLFLDRPWRWNLIRHFRR